MKLNEATPDPAALALAQVYRLLIRAAANHRAQASPDEMLSAVEDNLEAAQETGQPKVGEGAT